MLNKDIQQIRIDVVEMLREVCKDDPEKMYERVEGYLENLQVSLQQNKNSMNNNTRGNTN